MDHHTNAGQGRFDCAACGATQALAEGFYTPSGAIVCRVCDATKKIVRLDAQAQSTQVDHGEFARGVLIGQGAFAGYGVLALFTLSAPPVVRFGLPFVVLLALGALGTARSAVAPYRVGGFGVAFCGGLVEWWLLYAYFHPPGSGAHSRYQSFNTAGDGLLFLVFVWLLVGFALMVWATTCASKEPPVEGSSGPEARPPS